MIEGTQGVPEKVYQS